MQPADDNSIAIFVSYSSEDGNATEFVDAVISGIAAVPGVVPVWDRRFLPGENWADAIARGIKRSHGAIVILSPCALTSDWVQKEADWIDYRKRLDPGTYLVLPVFAGIDGSALDQKPWKNLEIPRLHAISDYSSPEQLRESVTENVRRWAETNPEAIRGQGRVFTERMPRTGTNDLFGRDRHLERFGQAWSDNTPPILAIVAPGGVGKSALCRKWLSDIAPDYLSAERVYAWSFYSQGTTERNVSADPFMHHALAWFGDAKPQEGSQVARGTRLARLIRSKPTILILDGLEPLQFPPGEGEGQLKDKALKSLLRCLADEPGKCLVIVTTRLPITDLRDFEEDRAETIRLDNLSFSDGAKLLASRGVKQTYPGQLEELARDYGGHALALLLVGNYLHVLGGDPQCLEAADGWIEEEQQGGHARRVMASYARWFRDNDKRAEIELLYVLGLFDRPAPGDAIDALRQQPAIDGLTETLCCMNAYRWEATVSHLRSLGLLAHANEFEPDALDAHPLVRQHFGHELEHENPNAWKEGHRRLYRHLASHTEDFPDDPQEMDRLYSAVNHACACGELQEAFRDLIFRRAWRRGENRNDFNFATRKLGMMSGDFVALAQFFDVQWVKLRPGLDFEDELKILTDTGVRLRSLGRIPHAMEALGEAVRRVEQQWDPALAEDGSYAAAQLSELQLICGKLRQAEQSARIAIRNGDMGSDPFFRMHARSSLADVMMQSGKLDAAAELFEQARDIEEREKPEVPFMHSQTCYRYGNFLLQSGTPEKVVAIANSIDIWGTSDRPSLLSRAIDKLVLARAYLALARSRSELPDDDLTSLIDEAVEDLTESGYSDYLIRGLITQTRIRAHGRQYELARQALNRAEREAERGRMMLLKFDVRREDLLLTAAESGNPTDGARTAELRTWARALRYKRGLQCIDNPHIQ
jgi:tetratricopeptide (TPR) repeat protein